MSQDTRTALLLSTRVGRALWQGGNAWAATLLIMGWGAYRIATTMSLQQAHDPLGGRFIPVLVSVSLMSAAVAVIVRTTIGGLRQGGAPRSGPGKSKNLGVWERAGTRVLTMLAIAIVFISIMDAYRFVPGAIVGMAASMRLLGERRPSRLVLVPTVTAIVVFLIFTRLLLVRLP